MANGLFIDSTEKSVRAAMNRIFRMVYSLQPCLFFRYRNIYYHKRKFKCLMSLWILINLLTLFTQQ